MLNRGPRSLTGLLALSILVLLGQAFWQQHRLQALKDEMGFQQRHFDEQVGRLAVERLQGRREELVDTIRWLQEYYGSDDGLRRPNGLWVADRRQLDAEAIGAWVFDVYLNARVSGATRDEARQAIVDAIRGSDEWRRAHQR